MSYADEVFKELEEKVYGDGIEADVDAELEDGDDDDLDEYETGWQFCKDDSECVDVDYSDDFNDRYKPKKNNIVITR